MEQGNPYRKTIIASFVGYIVQATVCTFPPLLFVTFRTAYGITLAQLSLLITLTFAIQLVGDLVMPHIVARAGSKPCIIAANALTIGGLVLLPVFPAKFGYGGLLCAALLYSLGASIIEVLISPTVEACPTKNKSGMMSLLHSFFAIGCALVIGLSTAFLALFGRQSWKLLCLFWAIPPLIDIVLFALAPMPELAGENGARTPIKSLLKSRTMVLLLALMIAAGAAELCVSQWASSFAEAGLGVSKATGDLLGPLSFAVLMAAGRLFYAARSKKMRLWRYMLISALICAAGYLVAGLSPIPAVSLLGCGLVGFGCAVLWPGALSIGADRLPNGGTTLFSLMACCGDIGCTVGPTYAGFLADRFGENLQLGLLGGLIFPAAAVILLLALRKK